MEEPSNFFMVTEYWASDRIIKLLQYPCNQNFHQTQTVCCDLDYFRLSFSNSPEICKRVAFFELSLNLLTHLLLGKTNQLQAQIYIHSMGLHHN